MGIFTKSKKKIVIKINKDKYCCEADKLRIER